MSLLIISSAPFRFREEQIYWPIHQFSWFFNGGLNNGVGCGDRAYYIENFTDNNEILVDDFGADFRGIFSFNYGVS